MPRSILSLIVLPVLILGFTVADVQAVGVGIYNSAGLGTGDIDFEFSPSDHVDTDHIGFGFVLDSNVAQDRVFNYRLKIGYERLSLEGSRIQDYQLKMKGIIFENTFGFGVLRTNLVRLWLGPQVRIGFFPHGDIDQSGIVLDEENPKMYGLGLGPVIGTNFNISPVITLSFDAGYIYSLYGGRVEHVYYIDDEDFDVEDGQFSVNLSLLFRFHDTFK